MVKVFLPLASTHEIVNQAAEIREGVPAPQGQPNPNKLTLHTKPPKTTQSQNTRSVIYFFNLFYEPFRPLK